MTEADRIAEFANVPHQLAEIVVMEANAACITVNQLRSESRSQFLVRIRRKVAERGRSIGCSYPKIGRALNRDHSTVMHIFKRIK